MLVIYSDNQFNIKYPTKGSPMTSFDAETDFKPIIINIIILRFLKVKINYAEKLK